MRLLGWIVAAAMLLAIRPAVSQGQEIHVREIAAGGEGGWEDYDVYIEEPAAPPTAHLVIEGTLRPTTLREGMLFRAEGTGSWKLDALVRLHNHPDSRFVWLEVEAEIEVFVPSHGYETVQTLKFAHVPPGDDIMLLLSPIDLGELPADFRFGVQVTEYAVPTISEWGLVIMTLALLTGAKIYFGRRRITVTYG